MAKRALFETRVLPVEGGRRWRNLVPRRYCWRVLPGCEQPKRVHCRIFSVKKSSDPNTHAQLPAHCDSEGWPMFEETHFRTRKEAWQQVAKDNKMMTQVHEELVLMLEKQLADAKAAATRHRSLVIKRNRIHHQQSPKG